jgi:hypothetical protein
VKRLLFAELRRYRFPILVVALANLGLLGFVSRLTDLLQQPRPRLQVAGMLAVFLGVGLAAHQIGGYRRLPRWMQLLHRPVPPLAVAGSLVGAAAIGLFFAVAVPMLLVVLAYLQFTTRVVDLRHWLMPIAAWQLAVFGHLLTSYVLLAPTRWSALAVMLLVANLWLTSSGIAYLLVTALFVLVTFGLLASVFRPERRTPPRRRLVEMSVALVLAFSAHAAIEASGTLGYQLGSIALGLHPLNGTPPPGGIIEAERAKPGKALLPILEGVTDPQAAQWRHEVTLAPSHRIDIGLPDRAGMTLGDAIPMVIVDREHEVRWTFSKDAMRFRGLAIPGEEPRGWLGACGEARFPSAPMVLGKMALLDDTLYVYDADTQTLCPRYALAAGEIFASEPIEAGRRWAILGSRSLHLLPVRALEPGAPPVVARRVALPRPIGDLVRVDWVELLDDELILFTYGRGSSDPGPDPWQILLHVDAEGRSRVLAERPLRHDFPALQRYRAFALSPLLSLGRELVLTLGAPPVVLGRDLVGMALSPPPPPVIAIAAGLAVLALLGLALTWRRADGIAWWPFVLVTGVAGWVAFLVLRRGER